jgi:hypothetical protein
MTVGLKQPAFSAVLHPMLLRDSAHSSQLWRVHRGARVCVHQQIPSASGATELLGSDGK